MTSQLEFKLKDKGMVTVDVPDHTKQILESRLFRAVKRNIIHMNIFEDKACYVCGVNQTRLNPDQINWVKRHICKNCDHSNPFILQHVTEVCGFSFCDMSWYCNVVMNIPEPTNEFMLEGIITHRIDNYITDYLADKKIYKRFEEMYPDRDKIYKKVMEELNSKVTEIIDKTIKRRFVTSEVADKVKAVMFDTTLKDFAYLTTMRLWYNIMSGGDYQRVTARKWYEKKVIGYYSNHNVNVFNVGRIDKLYKLADDSFVIRDKKTSRVIRSYALKGGNFFDASLQLGGYLFLLRQCHNVNVKVLGEIELSRYMDTIPIICDDKAYIDTLDKLCLFINKGSVPMRHFSGQKCNIKYCGYWNTCWGKK